MDVAAAKAFAIAAHGDQRYGEHAYRVHLAAVGEIVETFAQASDDAQAELLGIVAWLHDVLEDTAIDAAALRDRFGEVITIAVDLVSDPPGDTRRVRKVALHRRLAAVDVDDRAGRAALIVKAADRLANANASVKSSKRLLAMYSAEHSEFRAAVFRPGLCDSIWSEIDRLLG